MFSCCGESLHITRHCINHSVVHFIHSCTVIPFRDCIPQLPPHSFLPHLSHPNAPCGPHDSTSSLPSSPPTQCVFEPAHAGSSGAPSRFLRQEQRSIPRSLSRLSRTIEVKGIILILDVFFFVFCFYNFPNT
jgi:hypothetical protein